MAFEELKEDILSTAKAKEKAIIQEAESEKQKLLSKAEEEARRYREQQEEDARGKAEAYKRQLFSGLEFEKRRSLLESQNLLLAELYAEAKENIQGFAAERRKAHVTTLAGKASGIMDIGTIMVNEKDRGYVPKGDAKVEPAQISGGIIAVSKDGSVRLDLSYDTLLRQAYQENIPQIARTYFNGA